ncbi:MAG: cytochrome c family protein [Caulobacterales bacterium]
MRLRAGFIFVAMLGLAACGQQPAEQAAAPTPAPSAKAEAPPMDASALPAPYNTADLVKGQQQFARCASCHAAGPGAPNRTGPSLHGVFERKAGTAPGFSYSDAFTKAEFHWDAATMDQYITNPRSMLPGNRMAFVGIKDPEDRKNLIAYLLLETHRK